MSTKFKFKVGDRVITTAQGVFGSAYDKGDNIECVVLRLPGTIGGTYYLEPPADYFIRGKDDDIRPIWRQESELGPVPSKTDAELADLARRGREAAYELTQRGYEASFEWPTNPGHWDRYVPTNRKIRFTKPAVTETVVKTPMVVL